MYVLATSSLTLLAEAQGAIVLWADVGVQIATWLRFHWNLLLCHSDRPPQVYRSLLSFSTFWFSADFNSLKTPQTCQSGIECFLWDKWMHFVRCYVWNILGKPLRGCKNIPSWCWGRLRRRCGCRLSKRAEKMPRSLSSSAVSFAFAPCLRNLNLQRRSRRRWSWSSFGLGVRAVSRNLSGLRS